MAQRAESRPAFRFSSLAASARAQAQTWTLNALNAACSKLFDRSRFVSFGRLGNGSRTQSRQRSPRCKNGTVWNVVSREHQSSGVFHLYSVEWSESSRQVGHPVCLYCLYSAPQTESYQRIPKPSHLVPQFLSPAGWISISEAQSASVSHCTCPWGGSLVKPALPDVEVRISAACLGTKHMMRRQCLPSAWLHGWIFGVSAAIL